MGNRINEELKSGNWEYLPDLYTKFPSIPYGIKIRTSIDFPKTVFSMELYGN